jgi:hypothetical protein
MWTIKFLTDSLSKRQLSLSARTPSDGTTAAGIHSSLISPVAAAAAAKASTIRLYRAGLGLSRSAWLPYLQDVNDAKVQHHILGLRCRILVCWERSGHHMHAQLHPLLPHAVADLVSRASAERHRPAGDSKALIRSLACQAATSAWHAPKKNTMPKAAMKARMQ